LFILVTAVAVAVDHLTRRRFDQPDDAAPGRRLAAAALAHQPQGFAGQDDEANVVDRAHVPHGSFEQPALDGEILLHIADFYQWHIGRYVTGHAS
jgi:hypothetical protein